MNTGESANYVKGTPEIRSLSTRSDMKQASIEKKYYAFHYCHILLNLADLMEEKNAQHNP